MPLECLKQDLTPVGLHYTLVHFDVHQANDARHRLDIGGEVSRTASFTLAELEARGDAIEVAAVMECAGNGRSTQRPRPARNVPWTVEAVGHAVWRGVPLRRLLRECGAPAGDFFVAFTGADCGVEGGRLQHFQRCLRASQIHDEVLVAFAMNGARLAPQHGFPFRLLCPGFFGMASVKWLTSVHVCARDPSDALIQQNIYRATPHGSPAHSGPRVLELQVRALMVPPGVPDFGTRLRLLPPGRTPVEGRAWAGGGGEVRHIELSIDGGRSWTDAHVDRNRLGKWSWFRWCAEVDVQLGRQEWVVRATDAAGHRQPLGPVCNREGLCNNSVQRVDVLCVELPDLKPSKF